jgi:hypothetical protein
MTDTSSYLGNQDQGSNVTDFNALVFLIRQEIARLHTATIVKIVKAPYDKQGNPITPGAAVPIGYVDVQPLVNQIDGRGKSTPHGTVYKLSYHRYQGANGAFVSDPAVGDIGHFVVSSRDTSSVRANDAAANPGSRRSFDLADGTYVGQTQAKAPTQYFSWTADGFKIVDKHGNMIVSGADGITITAVGAGAVFKSTLVSNTGNITAGAGGSDSVTLQKHTHPTAPTGSPSAPTAGT